MTRSKRSRRSIEALGVADLSVFHAKASRFEVRKHRFNAPTLTVFEGPQVTGRFGQSDDPGFGVARILDDGNMGAGWFAGEVDIF